MKLPILNKLFKKNTMKRTTRLNSLLKEVISEVIKKDVGNPNISKLTTITKVEITKDLHQAKVFISIIGTPEEKTKTLKALESASSFISIKASKKVVMKYFPSLITPMLLSSVVPLYPKRLCKYPCPLLKAQAFPSSRP